MANARYPITRKAFLDGALPFLSADIKVAAVGSAYAYSAAHDFLADLSGIIATSPNLASKTTTGGVANCAMFTFAAVAGGSTVTGFVVYRDTGSSATSELIVYFDTLGDSTPISIATDGGDIEVTPNAAGLFAI